MTNIVAGVIDPLNDELPQSLLSLRLLPTASSSFPLPSSFLPSSPQDTQYKLCSEDKTSVTFIVLYNGRGNTISAPLATKLQPLSGIKKSTPPLSIFNGHPKILIWSDYNGSIYVVVVMSPDSKLSSVMN